jgi:hypothetical protein
MQHQKVKTMNFNQFLPQNSLKAPDFKEVDVNMKLHKPIYIYMEHEEKIALEVVVL